MGIVTPVGSSAALADALLEILGNSVRFRSDPQAIRQRYTPDSIAAEYESMFETLWQQKKT
jgi:hypothetical protein